MAQVYLLVLPVMFFFLSFLLSLADEDAARRVELHRVRPLSWYGLAFLSLAAGRRREPSNAIRMARPLCIWFGYCLLPGCCLLLGGCLPLCCLGAACPGFGRLLAAVVLRGCVLPCGWVLVAAWVLGCWWLAGWGCLAARVLLACWPAGCLLLGCCSHIHLWSTPL